MNLSPHRKRAPFLVCFIGIDGSGKTTLAKAVVERLAQQGIESHYVWNRHEPWLLKPLVLVARGMFLRGKDSLQNYPEYSRARSRLFRNPLLSLAYRYLLQIDYSFQTLIKVQLPLMIGHSIVCDRYVHDTIADLVVDFNYSPERAKRSLGRLSWLLPRPDITLLVDIAEDVAYSRKDDIPSLELLRRRRRVYLEMSEDNPMVTLDGSQNPDDLSCLVQNMVNRLVL